MLAKINRIVHQKQIKLVYSSKYKTRNQHWTLISRKIKDQLQFKLLVVISKKISKQANNRNKIRRRIHSIVHQVNLSNPFDNNLSIIIQLQNSSIIKLTFEELQSQVQSSILTVIQPKTNFRAITASSTIPK